MKLGETTVIDGETYVAVRVRRTPDSQRRYTELASSPESHGGEACRLCPLDIRGGRCGHVCKDGAKQASDTCVWTNPGGYIGDYALANVKLVPILALEGLLLD